MKFAKRELMYMTQSVSNEGERLGTLLTHMRGSGVAYSVGEEEQVRKEVEELEALHKKLQALYKAA